MTDTSTELPSVLVVDDNPLIVNVLKGLLASQSYHVFACTNGKEALDVLGSNSVDVIICDVMMPKMGGYELHQSVREKPELSHIPFIFLTALSGEEDVCQGKETGADDYVIKPFDPRELLSVVKGKVVRSRKLKNLSEQQYDRFRKRIIHTLSHEFRTPLVAINTGTELLLEQKNSIEDSRAHNLLEAIQRGGLRLERLVNDFMLMQQIEAGIADRLFESRSTRVSVKEVVDHFLNAKRDWLEGEGGKIEIQLHEPDEPVQIYEPQILDVLTRLVDNAIKFSPAQKLVEISASREDDKVVIEVRDRGLGINIEQIREAIDLFGQINRDKLEQQGGGLGLAIANRYATVNKGRLEFDHRSGGGSIVSLVLPKAK